MGQGKEQIENLIKNCVKYIYIWISLGLLFTTLVILTTVFVQDDITMFFPTVIASILVIVILTIALIIQELKLIKRLKAIIKEIK